jgi:ABC transport system ATP-binding/permease protein
VHGPLNGGRPIDATPAADAPPFILIADFPVVIGRSGEGTLRLLHSTVSRRHATVTRTGGGFALEDHDSRFGTFANGARIRTATLWPGDRVRFGGVLTYRVEPGGLRLDSAAEGLEVVASGLAISPAGHSRSGIGRLLDGFRPRVCGRASADRPTAGLGMLVEGIGFRIRPDGFVGILGPSGAGKSTLLNCLAGFRPPDRGRVTFDGRDAYEEPEAFRAPLGHVPQDDVVFRALTSRENLDFAARLRLGTEVAKDELARAIDRALELVGLVEHADKPAAVLSGGQRKRLSVAIELLRRPRLLLLDEPTSGLDPASEAHLMEQLCHLARRGTTVVCTTHLMDNLGLFDEVVALGVVDGVGRLAYSGPPDGLLPRFGCRGFADAYELLASGRFEPLIDAPELLPTAHRLPSDFSSGRPPPDAGAVDLLSATEAPGAGRIAGLRRLAGSLMAETGRGQLAIVARRAIRQILRDRGLLAALVAQPLVLGLLAALPQYDATRSFSILFFAVVIAIWLGLNNAARDLVRERRHYVRDRLAGLEPGAYLGAKALVQAGFGAGQLLILVVTLSVGCAWVQDPRASGVLAGVSTIRWSAVLMLSYLGGVGLGLLASTLARTEEAAVAALPLLILPQLLIGAVAAGLQGESYIKPRPFRPLVVTLMSSQRPAGPAAVLDWLSMACPSRPAVLAADAPIVGGYGRWTWVGDLCHLVILVLGTWMVLFVVFRRVESRWLRLVGP